MYVVLTLYWKLFIYLMNSTTGMSPLTVKVPWLTARQQIPDGMFSRQRKVSKTIGTENIKSQYKDLVISPSSIWMSRRTDWPSVVKWLWHELVRLQRLCGLCPHPSVAERRGPVHISGTANCNIPHHLRSLRQHSADYEVYQRGSVVDREILFTAASRLVLELT